MIKINHQYFLLSLFIGFLLVYITAPKPEMIIKHPTLKNHDTTYIDEMNVCYKYHKQEVDCKTGKLLRK